MILRLLLKSELIKWDRSWAIATAVVTPSALTVFMFFFFWFAEGRAHQIDDGSMEWYRINYYGWNYFFLPITISLVASLSFDVERRADSWKHLFIQPVPRQYYFITKILSHTLLIILSQLLFLIFLLIGCCVLRIYVPTLSMGPLHHNFVFTLCRYSMFASIPLITIHTWITNYLPNPGTALIIPITGIWITHLAKDIVYVDLISPWGLLVWGVSHSSGSRFAYAPTLSCLLWGILFIAIGTLWFDPEYID